jgi:hypothetical protein
MVGLPNDVRLTKSARVTHYEINLALARWVVDSPATSRTSSWQSGYRPTAQKVKAVLQLVTTNQFEKWTDTRQLGLLVTSSLPGKF